MTRSIGLNDEVNFLKHLLNKEFVSLYKSWRSEVSNGAIYALLSPSDNRNEFLSSPSWPLHIGDGLPSFSAIPRGQHMDASYHPISDNNLLPLAFIRSGEGILKANPEPLQELILFHNLFSARENHEYLKILQNGETEVVLKIGSENDIQIRTSYLVQFQAAKQMDLMFELDSVQFVSEKSDVPSEQNIQTQSINLSVYPLDNWSQLGYRALGKVIFPPKPIEFCGIWPFENDDEITEQFTIIDALGKPSDISLNSKSRLDPNEFLRNQGAHYLESVEFHKNVLQRYFADPEVYEVKDGILKCGHLWSLSIDNDHPDKIFVYLGDLLRDLPAAEWKFWKPFNLADGTQMSDTSFKRNILGQFVEPQRPDLRFRATFQSFQKDWVDHFGWNLFLPLTVEDDYVLKSLRIPNTDSFQEFDSFTLSLAKLLTNSLNGVILSELTKIPIRGDRTPTLERLRIWLENSGFEEHQKVKDSLHMVQWLRSNSAAHPKEREVREEIRAKYGFSVGRDFCHHLCDSATDTLNLLSEHFLLP